MTVIELAKYRQRSELEKMQRRQERYAAMGPNCPNGHPWTENERLESRKYRFCGACAQERFARRIADGSIFNGKCPKGHSFTKENTVLVHSQLTRMCLICKRAASARARVLKADLIPTILQHARNGATVNAMLGRGPNAFAKALAPNSVTLTRLTNLRTPEGRELKQLFKQNERMAHVIRYGAEAWLPAKREFLAAQYERTRDVTAITAALNERFGSSHTFKAVRARASKWSLTRAVVRPPVLIDSVASLRFPTGSLMERLVALLPKNIARDHRDDLISEIAVAVFEGRVPEAGLEAHVRQMVRQSFNADHDRWGDVSLDVAIPGTDLLRIDTISEGLWA